MKEHGAHATAFISSSLIIKENDRKETRNKNDEETKIARKNIDIHAHAK